MHASITSARFPAAAILVAATVLAAGAQASPVASPASGPVSGEPAGRPVIVTGSVPDEASKAAIVERLAALYGRDRVIDEITVEGVVAPANWTRYVTAMLDDDLRQVSRGELHVDGNSVRLAGEVGSEDHRRALADRMAASLNPTWSIRNQLEVGDRRQDMLDEALDGRIIEFQSGSAALTAQGRSVLDEMARALAGIQGSRVEVVGHTDAVGDRQDNIRLSLARASEVKAYLVGRGIPGERLGVMGYGPDRPLADNDTDQGRARNRRIEFKVLD